VFVLLERFVGGLGGRGVRGGGVRGSALCKKKTSKRQLGERKGGTGERSGRTAEALEKQQRNTNDKNVVPEEENGGATTRERLSLS